MKEKNALSLAPDQASFFEGLWGKKRDHARVLPTYHGMVLADDISRRNQPKSFTSFLAYHFPRATHYPGYKILPQFM